jgi:hypothetical protein
VKALPLAILAAVAVLATERGRGIVASALISTGAALLPEPPLDPEREQRMADRVMREIMTGAWSRPGAPI